MRFWGNEPFAAWRTERGKESGVETCSRARGGVSGEAPHRGGRSIICAVLLIFLAAATPVFAQGPDVVTLRTDWLPLTYHAPFHLAVRKGYYNAVNIDLKIRDGRGSGNTIQLVANGADTFGLAEAGPVAKSVGQGVPVKMIMGILRRSAAAIIWPTEREIHTPADLKGKRITMCAGEATAILLPAYLKAVNVSPSDIKLVTVDCSAKYSVIAQGLADAALGYAPWAKQQFLALGFKDVRKFDYADVGIVLPATGVVAANKTIETKPDLVRRFIAATSKGWADALKNPEAAFDAMMSAVPALKGKEKALLAEFEDYRPYFTSTATRGRPFGWQSSEDWKQAETILTQYMDVKAQRSVDVYFTNEFIPE
jgi:NitT/TauT family transport system substrate-binding protein